MNDTPVQNSAPPRRGLSDTLLSWPGKVCGTLICSLFFSLVIEWLGIAFFWPEQGAEHSRMMMLREAGWFAGNVTRSLLITDPAEKLSIILHHTWQWFFIDTGLIPWSERLLRQHTGNAFFFWFNTYIQATVYITLTFVLRVFILLLTAPLFLLAALTGAVDGLVRRDIRRFGCGYESGFIYHHARQRVIPVFFLAWTVYLSLPFSVNPVLILLPAATLFGGIITLSVGAFKKYL
ncbi:TIGR03747 family integrating conjugative element membrane protein [Salmonella enterica subsp. diarizonae]|uniref:TIGR03747 family integrating conjugative element membrane protein n=1 Tax=Salmonella enterica TaxID=28901 RepID=UPI0012C8D3AB|nr:TIGR03747 family integrating conjugative element membrane protein [Salmonella enterica subsp. diarizonae]EIV4461487.1 TIGR03747 family integrating conjugative element membrane protein [Salmonella enterica]EJZ7021717.1 TIGR03747 family integrating conjugative element membrane protein [Salmonella enterica]